MKTISLDAENVSVGDLSVVIVSACHAISMMKELPEGAVDGVRDRLYELANTGPHGDESHGWAKMHGPKGAHGYVCFRACFRDQPGSASVESV